VTPAPGHHTFDAPDRFVVDAVGQPGEREFFLQASAGGTEPVTVAVEKAEVAALAEGMHVLLDEVRRSGRAVEPRAAAAAADRRPLQSPVEPSFALDRLTLAWDGEWVVVEAAATAPAPVADDDGFDDDELTDEDAAHEAATLAELDDELDDLDVPDGIEDIDEREQPVASLRVRLTLAQAAAFLERAESVVAAGRRPCPLCGRPDGPRGHLCPRLS